MSNLNRDPHSSGNVTANREYTETETSASDLREARAWALFERWMTIKAAQDGDAIFAADWAFDAVMAFENVAVERAKEELSP